MGDKGGRMTTKKKDMQKRLRRRKMKEKEGCPEPANNLGMYNYDLSLDW